MPDWLMLAIPLALFFYLLVAGAHIYLVMLLPGLLGILFYVGWVPLAGFAESDPYRRLASYEISACPLFILMAQFLMRSGIIEELFRIGSDK